MANIMPEAKRLVALLTTIRAKFNGAPTVKNQPKPDLVTIADAFLDTRPQDYVSDVLHEFDCMTMNYDVFNHDRAVLGGLRHDSSAYERKRLSFALRAIIYGQYPAIETEDKIRLEAARILAEQEELAS